MKKLIRLLTSRVTFVSVAILAQLILIVVLPSYFGPYYPYVYALGIVITTIAVIYLINKNTNPAYKIAWLVPIFLFPAFGGILYLLFGGNKTSGRVRKKLLRLERKVSQVLPSTRESEELLQEIFQTDPAAARQSTYLSNIVHCPPFRNTYTEYLPSGEVKFELMKNELRKAKHYIFLEYFIIQEGIMWNAILEILQEKVRQGVDVRVIYDDMGCIRLLPYKYNQQLEAMGIKCCVFNPFRPVLSGRFNNRDHRKIAVIDGVVGFTGGINLADEYINAYEKFGHWKDTAILLRGEAAWGLTVLFLTMWEYLRKVEENYEEFRPYFDPTKFPKQRGYVQPFTDSPTDHETVGENVYLNLINRANQYVYITTPYLVIDNEMFIALTNAAKSG